MQPSIALSPCPCKQGLECCESRTPLEPGDKHGQDGVRPAGRQDLHRTERRARISDTPARQPPRPHHRRHRHRQDRHAAGAGRGLLRWRACRYSRPTSRAISPASRARGEPKPPLVKRAQEIGLADYDNRAYPAVFWDLFGEKGHPVRATVQEMGPLLLSRMLELNEAQEGVLNIAFRVAADEQGCCCSTSRTCARSLTDVGDNAARRSQTKYGNVSAGVGRRDPAPAAGARGAGRRRFLRRAGARHQGPHRTRRDGRGVINMLAADKLMQSPRLYATFLLWLLSELFEQLPEVGDPDKPKLVFFFDEAHLLFSDAPKALLDKVEQVVRLIRSKGVGVYFVTQNPRRRARQRARPSSATASSTRCAPSRRASRRRMRAAAETFRPNPELDTERRHPGAEGGRGAGLVAGGQGRAVDGQRTLIRPPSGRIGPDHGRGAPQARREQPRFRQVRGGPGPRFSLRAAAEEG